MHPVDSQQDPACTGPKLLREDILPLSLSLATLVLTAAICAFASHFVHRGIRVISDDAMYVRTIFRFYVIMIGSFVAAFLAGPSLDRLAQSLGRRTKPVYTYAAPGRRLPLPLHFPHLLRSMAVRRFRLQHPHRGGLAPNPRTTTLCRLRHLDAARLQSWDEVRLPTLRCYLGREPLLQRRVHHPQLHLAVLADA